MNMPSFQNAFPSKYLRVADLNGRAVPVTIESVMLETVGMDSKYVARFKNCRLKPVVLNKSNCLTIAEIGGSDDVDTWPGLRVEVFPTTTDYQGKRVGCIRIRTARSGGSSGSGGSGSGSSGPTSPPSAASATDDIDDAMPTLDEVEY
jgi:hypothetical protein